MSDKQEKKVTKKAFRLTKNQIITIAVVLSLALFVGTIAIIRTATQNPGVKVFKSYLSAAKSQDVEKMASTFYSKKDKEEKKEYDKFVESYKQGKSEYKEFIDSRSAQDEEVLAFLIAPERLNNPDDLRDYGLRLDWEQRLAKKIKRKFDYSILSQDANQIKLTIKLSYTEQFLATHLPRKYSSGVGDSVKEILHITFRRNPNDNKWYFASDFRLTYGQANIDTWYAPYDNSGNLEVKRINPYTVPKNFDLTELADNIVSIGSEAFAECEALEKLIIPEGLVNIGWDAFRGCTNLKEIVYPDGSFVTMDSNIIVGEGAFRECKELRSFQIPSVNKTIPNYVFFNCQNLEVKSEGSKDVSEYKIFEDVTAIGHYAFYGCRSIEKIMIPSTVTSIGDGAFEGCTSLKVIGDEKNVLHDNIIRIGTNAFKNCTSLTSISLPKNITEIKIGTFNKNGKLSSVVLPQNLKSIGNYAFAETALTEFVVPSTVERIGQYAFYNLEKLGKLEFAKENDSTSITAIGANAFAGCLNIVTLDLPQTIKSIGDNAFFGCDSLRSVMVNFPSSTIVGEAIFSKQAGIPKVYVKQDLNQFSRNWYSLGLDIYSQDIIQGDFAIAKESRTDAMGNTITENVLVQYLGTDKKVTLDKSITRIGDGAFSYSKTLEEITNFAELNLTDVGLDVFAHCDNLKYDIYGTEAVGQLKYLGNWLIGYQTIDSNLDLTDYNRFRRGSTPLPKTVGIAAGAFTNAELNYVKISKDLKYICDQAFMLAVELVNIDFEESSQLERIGDNAFYSCDALDHIILPSTLKEVGDNAFGYCTNLRYVIFNSDQNIALGTKAFNVYDNILKLYIKGYETSEYYATNQNWSEYSDSIYDTSIIDASGDYAVKSIKLTDEKGTEYEHMTLVQMLSTGLTEFKIPASVKRIGPGAFAKSLTLEKVEIPAGVVRIEKYAFYNCTQLFDIVFKAENGQHSLEYIGTHAFIENPALSDQDGRIVFEPSAPNEKFSVGDEPFEAFELDRKVIVSKRANYEQHPYWKENRDMLNAEDDPRLILELAIVQGNTGVHLNSVSPDEGTHARAPGFVQSINAYEDKDNGYEFIGWYDEDDKLITKDASTQVEFSTADSILTYTAKFSRVKAWATIIVDEFVYGGEVYLGGDKLTIDQSTDYKAEFLTESNSTFTLKAKHFKEFVFIGWFIGEEKISDSLEQAINMGYLDVEIEARFERVKSWVSITQHPGGKVELVSEHAAENIQKTENEIRVLLALGETVTVKATPDEFYEFSHWTVSGNQIEGNLEETFELLVLSESDMPIFANFVKINVDVSVEYDSDKGKVYVEVDDEDEEFTTGKFAHGSKLKFTAQAKEGYSFKHWVVNGETIEGEILNITITDDQPISIQAVFEAQA